MRRVGALYLLLLACEFVAVIVVFTQRGVILSDASSVRVAWTRTWGGPYRDYSYDAVVSGGALFVTGASSSYGRGPVNLLLLKYDADGGLVWNKTYWEDGYAMGRGIAARGGYVYVCGIHIAEDAAYSLLLKYGADGTLIWSREWRPESDAKSTGLALDSAGNVYVTGYVVVSEFKNRGFLLKYDEGGGLVWSRVFETEGTETDWGVSVGDAAYVCGEVTHNTTTLEKMGVPSASTLLRKIGLDGEIIWSEEAVMGLDNVANSVDAGADVVVAGYASFKNGTSRDVLLRYGRDGRLRLTQMLGDSTLGDMAWGVARAGAYTYVVGHARPYFTDLSDLSIYKLGQGGGMLWEKYYSDYSIDGARAVTVDGDDVYVVGETYWRNLDMQVLVVKIVSPNLAFAPGVSLALRLSPIAVGALLMLIAAYEGARAWWRLRQRSA